MQTITYDLKHDARGKRIDFPKWQYRLRSGPRCSGVEAHRQYTTRDLAIAASIRMHAAIKGSKGLSVRITDGERKPGAFDNKLVSWGFHIKTGPHCPGVNSSRFYSSRSSAEDAGKRMTIALLKAVAD